MPRRTACESRGDVRYFNRTRCRDGPRFYGCYRAIPVRSERQFRTLIRYIDQNAPQARLASTAAACPFGSAALYASGRRPVGFRHSTWIAPWAIRHSAGVTPPTSAASGSDAMQRR